MPVRRKTPDAKQIPVCQRSRTGSPRDRPPEQSAESPTWSISDDACLDSLHPSWHSVNHFRFGGLDHTVSPAPLELSRSLRSDETTVNVTGLRQARSHGGQSCQLERGGR